MPGRVSDRLRSMRRFIASGMPYEMASLSRICPVDPRFAGLAAIQTESRALSPRRLDVSRMLRVLSEIPNNSSQGSGADWPSRSEGSMIEAD